jgi:hypothetical protein
MSKDKSDKGRLSQSTYRELFADFDRIIERIETQKSDEESQALLDSAWTILKEKLGIKSNKKTPKGLKDEFQAIDAAWEQTKVVSRIPGKLDLAHDRAMFEIYLHLRDYFKWNDRIKEIHAESKADAEIKSTITATEAVLKTHAFRRAKDIIGFQKPYILGEKEPPKPEEYEPRPPRQMPKPPDENPGPGGAHDKPFEL